jgi:hypothetical protein
MLRSAWSLLFLLAALNFWWTATMLRQLFARRLKSRKDKEAKRAEEDSGRNGAGSANGHGGEQHIGGPEEGEGAAAANGGGREEGATEGKPVRRTARPPRL